MTRHVRDADFWGLPVGTPIKPGMKPQPKTPDSGGTSTTAKPKPGAASPNRRIVPARGKKPSSVTTKPEKDSDAEQISTGGEPDTSVRENKDFSVESAAKELKKIKKDGRADGEGSLADPIDCGDDIKKAHQLLAEGKHIRLNSPEEVSLLIDQLAEEAAFAKETGAEIPDYDLCKVTVPATNLFCLETKGIPRAQMPQFSGQPMPGSYAEAKADADPKGEADVTDEFGDLLATLGISVEEVDMPVDHLKATQSQLVGTKVAGMRAAMRKGKIKDEAIYVTKDGYIVDGHHRWAAKMALDLEDGKLGDVDMPVKKIDADIGYILDLSNGFTEMAGIKPKGTGKNAEGVKILARLSRLAGNLPEHRCASGSCEMKGDPLLDAYLSKVEDFLEGVGK
jgi:hypothetical protein